MQDVIILFHLGCVSNTMFMVAYETTRTKGRGSPFCAQVLLLVVLSHKNQGRI